MIRLAAPIGLIVILSFSIQKIIVPHEACCRVLYCVPHDQQPQMLPFYLFVVKNFIVTHGVVLAISIMIKLAPMADRDPTLLLSS